MRIAAAAIVAVLLCLTFWCRGVVRGNQGDMAVGLLLLLLFSSGVIMADGSSAIFAPISGVFFLFGLATLVAGSFARADCALKRRDRIGMAVLFIILGFLGAFII